MQIKTFHFVNVHYFHALLILECLFIYLSSTVFFSNKNILKKMLLVV